MVTNEFSVGMYVCNVTNG